MKKFWEEKFCGPIIIITKDHRMCAVKTKNETIRLAMMLNLDHDMLITNLPKICKYLLYIAKMILHINNILQALKYTNLLIFKIQINWIWSSKYLFLKVAYLSSLVLLIFINGISKINKQLTLCCQSLWVVAFALGQHW